MQSPPQKPSLKFTFKLERRDNCTTDSSSLGHVNNTSIEPIAIPSSSSSSSYSEDSDNKTGIEDEECTNPCKQLVLYDPAVNGSSEVQPVPDPEPVRRQRSFFGRTSSRVLPSVGAFTVQCANCFKWRLIPTKHQYEKIRENILEQPFYCEAAREWRPDISCDDPEDISQDGSRLWAIDKPNIATPPSGWERLLRIRGEGSTKFADVYYVAPSGKRLRSMVEIQRYLLEHPELMNDGVSLSQFSFQTPKPLQENYVRKRPREPKPSEDANRLIEPDKVPLLPWTEPDYCTDLQLGMPTLPHPLPPTPPPFFDAPPLNSIVRPAKKQVRRSPLN